MVRVRYNHIIAELRDDLLNMSHMVEESLSRVMTSLETWNATTASWIIKDDAQVDALRYTLEERVAGLLATQQPIVASDLRLVLVVGFIATEVERIGDYAKSIAKRVARSAGHGSSVLPDGLLEMGKLACQMLHISLEAFLKQDCELARELKTTDERVDAYQDQLRARLFEMVRTGAQPIEVVADLLDVVHVFERIADRATNIGERVIYLVTSEVEALNP